MSRSNLLALLILLSSVFISCNDVFEKDISNETPLLIVPIENDTIPVNPVHFKWNELSGATKYKIEIVSPSFNNIQSFLLDSIVSGTNFYVDLDSNQYQMRLTALNAGYTSKTSSPITFWVGSSLPSNNGGVTLDSPTNNGYLNESFNGVYSWFALGNVSSYTFELHKTNSFSGQTLVHADQLGTTNITSYNGLSLEPGVYCWGVKAFLTNGSETSFSKHIFTVDTLDPGNATLLSPANNANLNSGLISFSWDPPSNLGSNQAPLISILEISLNSSFSSILTPIESNSSNTVYDITNSGTYYWRIRMKDAAGNFATTPSSYRTFTIF